jgi:hypothetical protein
LGMLLLSQVVPPLSIAAAGKKPLWARSQSRQP